MDSKTLAKAIGKRLAKFRNRIGLKQKELAEALGRTTSSVGNWEIGKAFIPMDVLFELMDRFDLNPIWLIRGDGPMFLSKLFPAKEKLLDKEQLLKGLLSDPWIRELIELYIKGADYHAAVGHKLRELLESLEDNI